VGLNWPTPGRVMQGDHDGRRRLTGQTSQFRGIGRVHGAAVVVGPGTVPEDQPDSGQIPGARLPRDREAAGGEHGGRIDAAAHIMVPEDGLDGDGRRRQHISGLVDLVGLSFPGQVALGDEQLRAPRLGFGDSRPGAPDRVGGQTRRAGAGIVETGEGPYGVLTDVAVADGGEADEEAAWRRRQRSGRGDLRSRLIRTTQAHLVGGRRFEAVHGDGAGSGQARGLPAATRLLVPGRWGGAGVE
jgi:hypothetical protein